MDSFAFSSKDLRVIINDEFKRKCITHHLESTNHFYTTGLKQIMTDTFKIEVTVLNKRTSTPEDQRIDKVHVEVKITNISLKKPEDYSRAGTSQALTPKKARLQDLTYSSPLKINAEIIATAFYKDGGSIVKTGEVKDFKISGVPTMVRSEFCHTYGLSNTALKELGEDPTDPGGYFIIKGIEWVIDNLENIKYNDFHIYHNVGHKNELAHGEMISKPGDAFENSAQIILLLLNDGKLVCRIVVQRMQKEGKYLELPFYVIFRALGMTNDREMIENIVYSLTGDLSMRMQSTLERAMRVDYPQLPRAREIYDQNEMLIYLGENLDSFINQYSATKELTGDEIVRDNKQKYIISTVLDIFDKYFLPHVGLTAEYRNRKLRFFGHLIYKLLLVEMDIIKSSDRDSYANKRIHPPGVSYSKAFKTQFNFAVVQTIKKQMIKEIRNTPFSNIDWSQIVRMAINGTDFEKALVQAITSSDSKLRIQHKVFTNHLSAQQLHRKNPLNVLSTLRQVISPSSSSSKGSERADEMRRVQSSYPGYICCFQSADTGPKVGMQKQMTISASITPAGISCILKQHVLADKSLLPLDKVPPIDIYRLKLAKVFVNGEWIGLVQESFNFVKRYREMRRVGEIDRMATIYIDLLNDEVHLWVDVGRIVRPLLIVYNTDSPHLTRPFKSKTWQQGLALTPAQLKKMKKGELGINDLIEDGVVEYINPEEHTNCFIAVSCEALHHNRNNPLKPYTHCEIPQAIAGIAALTCPLATNNQLPRVCFQTNQVKQTCSWFALNWQHRADKEAFLQYYCEEPLVRTVANDHINPSGSNVIVAIMFYEGYNQEDSIIFNETSIARGLFNGTSISFERSELDRDEEFSAPDVEKTLDIRSNANYGKLKPDGSISKGIIINSGDVIIGKRVALPSEESSPYCDRSIVYTSNESAIVENVIVARNQSDNAMMKVIYRSIRRPQIGDKFCLTEDHQLLTEYGIIPIGRFITTGLYKKYKVATLKDGKICYDKVTDIYEGETNQFAHIDTSDMNCVCTIGHKFYSRFVDESEYRFRTILELYKGDRDFVIPRGTEPTITSDNDTIKIELLTLYICAVTVQYSDISVLLSDVKLTFGVPIQNRDLLVRNEIEFIVDDYQIIHIVDPRIINFAKRNKLFRPNGGLVLDYYLNVLSTRDKMNILDMMIETESTQYHIMRNLALRLGRVYNIIDGKFVAQESDEIVIKHDDVKWKQLSRNKPIYCIEVPSHVFYVQRKGLGYWSGNSSRAGQKGTCGMYYKQADMPFTASGLVPDLILNPHAFPSRMTINQIIESLISKMCAVEGHISDGTMFDPIDIDSICAKLKSIGMDEHCEEWMYNGKTGERIKCKIFIAPCYYQRLQKFVNNAMYAVSSGPTCAITRQPLGGKASSGGLRLGEMERDVCISDGATNFLKEKFYDHSDGFTVHICARCGSRNTVVVNELRGKYVCKRCHDLADIYQVSSSWSAKLFEQEVRSIGIGMKWHLAAPTFEQYL